MALRKNIIVNQKSEIILPMKYYSLNHNAPKVSFQEAVIQASDKGLYFPESITQLPQAF
jgi:threonine synthase